MLTYTSITLASVKEDGTTLRGPYTAFPVSGAVGFAFGERMRATIQITSSTPLASGDVFVMNAATFNQIPQYLMPAPAEGWRIMLTGTSGSLGAIASPLGALNQTNIELSASVDVTDTVITLLFDFYAVADNNGWLGSVGSGVGSFNNQSALQRDGVASAATYESQAGRTVYGQPTKYLEFSFYQADASLLPVAGGIAVDTTNGNATTCATKVKGKFFDRDYENAQSVSGGVYSKESLMSFELTDENGTTTCLYAKNGLANNLLDTNFSLLSAPSKGLAAAGVNTATLVIERPTLASSVTGVMVRLFRVDGSLFSNSNTFYQEALVDSVEVPASNLTPSPNWLSSEFNTFGTPASWSQTSTTLTVSIKLDGSKVALGQYRLMVLVATADEHFSSHVTPVFSGIQPIYLIGSMLGKIQTYNDEWLGDELEVSPYEPFRCVLKIDGSSFGAGLTAFEDGLLSATVTARYQGPPTPYQNALDASGIYDFANAVSGGTAPITATSAAGVYTLYADFWAFPNIYLIGNLSLVVLWAIDVDNAPVGQPSNVVTYTYEQRISIRPLDAIRLPSVRFLDVNTGNPLSVVCRDVEEVLVEITKDGPPDANLIAVAHNASGLAYVGNKGTAFLEAAYASPYLQQLSAALLSNVEQSFGDNIAYYRLKIGQIPASMTGPAGLFFAGALIYEPPLGLFSPSDLGTDLLLWLDADSLASAVIWIDNTENVNLTNGATSFTFVPSVSRAYLSGMQLSFDAGITHYTITSVVGSTVNLSAPIAETTGTYDVYVASVRNWADSSSYARTVQSPLALTPYYRTGQLAGSDSAFMLAPHYWNINPITASDPQNLQIVSLCRVDISRTGSASIAFAHRNAASPLIQIYEYQGAQAQIRSAAGGAVTGILASVNPALPPNFNISSYKFEQNSVGTQDLIECWNGGDEANKAAALTGLGTTNYSSSLQVIGNYNNGSYNAAFAGDFLQYFICENLALADIQKLEGWLAWKYGIQAQLPASHPYKTSQP